MGIKLEFAANGETPPAEENLPFDESANADEWTLVELSTVVPDEATIARIVCIYLADQSTTGEVHFDMATAERGGAPGVNQLSNPSFESGPGGANGIADWTEFSTPGTSEAQKSCFEVPVMTGSVRHEPPVKPWLVFSRNRRSPGRNARPECFSVHPQL